MTAISKDITAPQAARAASSQVGFTLRNSAGSNALFRFRWQ